MLENRKLLTNTKSYYILIVIKYITLYNKIRSKCEFLNITNQNWSKNDNKIVF